MVANHGSEFQMPHRIFTHRFKGMKSVSTACSAVLCLALLLGGIVAFMASPAQAVGISDYLNMPFAPIEHNEIFRGLLAEPAETPNKLDLPAPNRHDVYSMQLPKAPTFHPYNPYGSPDMFGEHARINGGWVNNFLNVKLSQDFQANIPKPISDQLAAAGVNPAKVDSFLEFQDMPWQNVDVLFRPQYWALPDVGHATEDPKFSVAVNARVGVFDPDPGVMLAQQDRNTLRQEGFSLHAAKENAISHEPGVALKTVIASPPNAGLHGLDYRTTTSLWTVTVSGDKAAVALHVLVNDAHARELAPITQNGRLRTLGGLVPALRATSLAGTPHLEKIEDLLAPTPDHAGRPVVTEASATVGPQVGGTAITLSGRGFDGATEVWIGNSVSAEGGAAGGGAAGGGAAGGGASVVRAGQGMEVVDDATIRFATAPGQIGQHEIRVIKGGIASARFNGVSFTYVGDAPAFTNVAPNTGPNTGGTVVTLTGRGFTGTREVCLGDTPVPLFGVVDDTTIMLRTPARVPGVASFSVTSLTGATVDADASRFTVAAPAVHEILPPTGNATDKTPITIRGTDLTGVHTVIIGGVRVTGADVKVVDVHTVTAVAPPHAPGEVDVQVIGPKGTSLVSPQAKFTYGVSAAAASSQQAGQARLASNGPPVIAGISPISGPAAGGSELTISGTNLGTADRVTIQGKPTEILDITDSAVKVRVPAGSGGSHWVIVYTSAGRPRFDGYTWM